MRCVLTSTSACTRGNDGMEFGNDVELENRAWHAGVDSNSEGLVPESIKIPSHRESLMIYQTKEPKGDNLNPSGVSQTGQSDQIAEPSVTTFCTSSRKLPSS